MDLVQKISLGTYHGVPNLVYRGDDGETVHDESNGTPEEGFNPEEENREAEDMPGDNADEREEAYDNRDADAADA